MKYTALVTSACLVTSIQEVFAQQTQNFDILRCFTPCNGGFTGNEIIPSTGCVWYHECWDGVLKDRKACGGPLVYNEELDYCDFPRNVNCRSDNIECPKESDATGNLFLNLFATPNPTRKPTRKPRTRRPTRRPTPQPSTSTRIHTTPPTPTPTTTRPITQSPSTIPTKEPTTPWQSQQPAFGITLTVGQQQEPMPMPMPTTTQTTTTTPWPSHQPAASPLLQNIMNGSPRAQSSVNNVGPSPMVPLSSTMEVNSNPSSDDDIMGLVENAGGVFVFPWNKMVFVCLFVTSTVHIIMAW